MFRDLRGLLGSFREPIDPSESYESLLILLRNQTIWCEDPPDSVGGSIPPPPPYPRVHAGPVSPKGEDSLYLIVNPSVVSGGGSSIVSQGKTNYFRLAPRVRGVTLS